MGSNYIQVFSVAQNGLQVHVYVDPQSPPYLTPGIRWAIQTGVAQVFALDPAASADIQSKTGGINLYITPQNQLVMSSGPPSSTNPSGVSRAQNEDVITPGGKILGPFRVSGGFGLGSMVLTA
jgi:hypothetical protein